MRLPVRPSAVVNGTTRVDISSGPSIGAPPSIPVSAMRRLPGRLLAGSAYTGRQGWLSHLGRFPATTPANSLLTGHAGCSPPVVSYGLDHVRTARSGRKRSRRSNAELNDEVVGPLLVPAST